MEVELNRLRNAFILYTNVQVHVHFKVIMTMFVPRKMRTKIDYLYMRSNFFAANEKKKKVEMTHAIAMMTF